MVRNLYFDSETTGLDPIRNDIIQIGAILEVGGNKIGEFSGYCRPINMQSISPQALAVNKTTLDQVKAYPEPRKLIIDFLKFLSPHFSAKDGKFTLIGQNVKFDYEFLKSFFYKNGYNTAAFNKIFDYQTIDLLGLTYLLRQKGIIPKHSKLKLEVMQEYFGIKVGQLHDALEDTRCTYEIIKKIEQYFFKNKQEVDWTVVDSESPLYKFNNPA